MPTHGLQKACRRKQPDVCVACGQGFCCLMQLSTRAEDFLVDVLALRPHVGPILAPVFADPQACMPSRTAACRCLLPSGYGYAAIRHSVTVCCAALPSVLHAPQVVKVLHGADSDIAWLQRDFGLYVANLFDTGQAARVLGFPSAALAYLLSRFCSVKARSNAY
jgi:exosome complex exonuclease RRP6